MGGSATGRDCRHGRRTGEIPQVSMIERAASPLPASIVTAARFASYPIFSARWSASRCSMASVGRRPVRDRRLASPEPAHVRNLALFGACVVIALIAWAWNFGLEVAVLGGSALASSPVQLALVGTALLVYALVSASIGFAGQQRERERRQRAGEHPGHGDVVSRRTWTGLSLLPDELLAVAHFTPRRTG